MANRLLPSSFVVSSKELVKNLQLKAAVIRSNQVFFSSNIAQGDGGIINEAVETVAENVESVSETVETKKTAEEVVETTTAEADTNVLNTCEYRSAQDLHGQLGDGCDHNIGL
ncbi:hypothetical protein HN51_044092 [Arachis hypogaea]|uniref:Uncharacterized protein n=1 Tax=Arachis hypogaea TaxID=3818 RepID=A0A444Y475_ARAHY|nr:uncharacterized protein LOC107612353 [Arachis ipaensis]XP_025674010.1 uncharacterized protein LOC112773163 [Arachis hypogaea]QHN96240.1 Chilling-induced protein, putative [Arachis hypogaea]RYQ96703.1 hypothetical protein Ahy_B08g092544 [Arachis hypogaea]